MNSNHTDNPPRPWFLLQLLLSDFQVLSWISLPLGSIPWSGHLAYYSHVLCNKLGVQEEYFSLMGSLPVALGSSPPLTYSTSITSAQVTPQSSVCFSRGACPLSTTALPDLPGWSSEYVAVSSLLKIADPVQGHGSTGTSLTSVECHSTLVKGFCGSVEPACPSLYLGNVFRL